VQPDRSEQGLSLSTMLLELDEMDRADKVVKKALIDSVAKLEVSISCIDIYDRQAIHMHLSAIASYRATYNAC
jgi:hypothetical protein